MHVKNHITQSFTYNKYQLYNSQQQ